MSKEKKITLSESQVWIVAKALATLTSDEGVSRLRMEFPFFDIEQLENDVDGIIDQLEEET